MLAPTTKATAGGPDDNSCEWAGEATPVQTNSIYVCSDVISMDLEACMELDLSTKGQYINKLQEQVSS